MRAPLLSLLCLFAPLVAADVTIYGLFGQTTADAATLRSGTATPVASTTSFVTTPGPPQYTELAAYNPIYMEPPPIPSPAPPLQFSIGVPSSAQLMNALSIPQHGTFFGFSIEMSVANQLSETTLFPQFLNLMNTVAQRAGAVHIRVGGNTQETAFLVESLPDGAMIEKDKEDASNPTSTPVLAFTPELLYMMANVSSLINARWYLGIPFNDTSDFRFQIAEQGEAILGDNLLGFQAANEPDLYAAHGHRPSTYGPFDFFGEYALLTQAYQNDSAIPVKNNLIAPSVSGTWTPEEVWNTGFVDSYTQYLGSLSVERYPTDNCAVVFPNPDNPPHDPLQELPQYLTHQAGIDIVQAYLNSTMLAQTWNKPFLMFETNTASCGGFPGISDTFTSALWGLDYALQMANSNFTGALFHFGGQNVSYNPFTAVPTNQSAFHQWTVGPIFYSSLFVAEALGQTNTSQVKDLFPNDGNDQTPAYAIYENGDLARMALINYMTDPTGAHDYVATISIGGSNFSEANGVPSSVQVKYLRAPSVSEKDNITWAGQTLGPRFGADGTWKGAESVETVQCDQTQNTCDITVPAPGAALVFFSDAAQQLADGPASTQTFATSIVTQTVNTVTVDASVLATSNGQGGKNAQVALGGTSQGGANGASTLRAVGGGAAALACVLGGAAVFARAFW
ncbi:glycoside hydrolase family 79 protein [Trametes versicolor FP-101664 SS1]|uniref:glycoside hydrolase family 79 protein n=1 Tax=Trametes versicolor (strain FP-101664) TaxID=717944 RepID=UPI00046228FB|nr:glycoside hydrolase family 79 protein [Trametes versicolor FP-101664 SS1]EIW64921.1 glycoside hydrolase family 79 protein [Trametes versicolor FP-101664 SS1]